MGKLMKYEIKGSYKFILGVLAIFLILTTVFYTQVAKQESFIIGLSFIIIFFATFLYIVGSFRKELYEDRGFLTFTLPLTGNQILGAKLLVALMWFVILGIVILAYNVFMVSKFVEVGLSFKEIFSSINARFVIASIIILVSGVQTLVLIYFSMALGRVTLKNKKIGGMWFVIFLVLSGLISYLQIKIIKALPVYLDLTSWKIISSTKGEIINQFTQTVIMGMGNEGLMFTANNVAYLNIPGILFGLVTTIVLFLSTGHIIENRIDL